MTRTMAEQLQGNQSDIQRRRLLFRSRHRGTQESDLILGSFAETFLTSFDGAQLDQFEALLDCTDADLFDWIFGGSAPPEHDHDVMHLLLDFRVRPHSRHYQYRQFSNATTTQE
ncbi:succinate dehydrogenase assembly factor 2 [Bradyrhizobium genosp. A]|uniref:succinate dehydrogenase assembly factor 2 n=1 Tax=Bradyrhizobium genosp. A TaxID=83626 RepID=UPI003CF38FEA